MTCFYVKTTKKTLELSDPIRIINNFQKTFSSHLNKTFWQLIDDFEIDFIHYLKSFF